MKIEKRVTRNTRRINACIRQEQLLREEVHSLTEELDDLKHQLDTLYRLLKDDLRRD